MQVRTSAPTVSSQFLRYVVVGASAFAVDLGVLLALSAAGMHHLVANTCSFLLANLFNFAAAHRFVFGSRARTGDWRALYLVILVISSVGLAINDVLLHAAITLLGWALVPAKVFATVATLLWNFAARKRLAYY